MCKMIDQYSEKIKGQFSFFDRILITGRLWPLTVETLRPSALYRLSILNKDFKTFFMSVTEDIKKRIEGMASESGRPVKYLSSSGIRKEDVAKEILQVDGIENGLICVLKSMETCKSAKVYGSDSGKLVIKTNTTKCLHYYLYYLDKEYGFMFLKIQTWFPFNIQVYINGRELMKHIFDANGITYQCYDNSFTDISDVAKAQELADHFDSRKLCRHLDGFSKSINPFLDTVIHEFGQGYYWCVEQCEYATDIMFQERSFLEDIYPSLVGHAFYDFTCTDVFTFMGRKPHPRFQGEAVSDYKVRPVGCRVKFKLKSNSIKMYDKYSVLRIETTINNPREFKVYGTVHHRDGTESRQWKPMGKSISNLYRYAEVSKACNLRFVNAMIDIVPTKSVLDEIENVSSPKKANGKRVAALNVWSPDTGRIIKTVMDGRFLLNGFRNKDVAAAFFPDMCDTEKRSSKTGRVLKKLHQHGLLRKCPRTRRYFITSKGSRIMGTLIELRNKDYPKCANKSA